MKKRWIVWIACFALTASLLSGCAKKTAQDPETAQAPEAVAAEEIQTEEPLEETVEEGQNDPVEESSLEHATAQPVQTNVSEQQQETSETTDHTETPAVQTPAAEEPASVPSEPVSEEPAGIADGTYSIAVGFSGGTGRASVDSPTTFYVENGKYYALITWSSPWYDYMIVNGTKYNPVNSSGNSQFKIPVVLDANMTVIGDTTAMSVPHEIEYTLYFDSSTIK